MFSEKVYVQSMFSEFFLAKLTFYYYSRRPLSLRASYTTRRAVRFISLAAGAAGAGGTGGTGRARGRRWEGGAGGGYYLHDG